MSCRLSTFADGVLSSASVASAEFKATEAGKSEPRFTKILNSHVDDLSSDRFTKPLSEPTNAICIIYR